MCNFWPQTIQKTKFCKSYLPTFGLLNGAFSRSLCMSAKVVFGKKSCHIIFQTRSRHSETWAVRQLATFYICYWQQRLIPVSFSGTLNLTNTAQISSLTFNIKYKAANDAVSNWTLFWCTCLSLQDWSMSVDQETLDIFSIIHSCIRAFTTPVNVRYLFQ